MVPKVRNLFADLPSRATGESFAALYENSSAKIERIVSRSHASPQGYWYDQPEEEWVMVLKGEATLEFADGKQIELKIGDYLTIPVHMKHRVARTCAATIWLAVHIKRRRSKRSRRSTAALRSKR